MAQMIICCGEALIDMIPAPVARGGEGFVPHAGGSVFNTAIGLGRLGVPAGMCSGISTDVFGQMLHTALEDSNVDTSTLIRSNRPTTLAFVQMENGHASYTFYDENSAGRMISIADFNGVGRDVAAMFFGGISLCSEPGASAYAQLAEREVKSRLIMLDPNIRSGFIEDVGSYRARLDKMIAHADIIKVSDEDLDWIFASDQSHDAKARALLETGTSMVVLTRGSKGASAFLASGEAVSIEAPKVAVVDTVGAGDTFSSGLLADLWRQGLLKRELMQKIDTTSAKQALSFASRVAAVTVSRAGANPPWAHEL